MAPGNTAQEKAINGTINGLGSADQNHPIRSWVHKLFQVCIYIICIIVRVVTYYLNVRDRRTESERA